MQHLDVTYGKMRPMLSMGMRRGTSAEDPVAELEQLVGSLDEDWKPLLAPAVAAQAAVLGVNPSLLAYTSALSPRSLASQRVVVRWAEVLVHGDELFVVVVRKEPQRVRRIRGEDGQLTAHQIPAMWSLNIFGIVPRIGSDALDKLQSLVESAVGFSLEPFHYNSQRFQELLEEGREAPEVPSADELAAARTLSDKGTRILATAIKSSSGLLMSDAAKQLPEEERPRVDPIIESLRAEKLVATEAVVICSKTGTQVTRMPSAELLPRLDEQGVRCSCGRSLLSERCEEALTVTDAARALIDGNRWFTIILIDELMKLGVPIESILVEQVSGGDEMDCIAVISGDMVLFELKDKTFSLGNAYSFGAKIGIMRPEKSIIVTTDQVGNDAKEHFERARVAGGRRRSYALDDDDSPDATPIYIEGLERLRPALEELVTEVTIGDASRVLSEVLPLASVGAQAVLRAWGADRANSN